LKGIFPEIRSFQGGEILIFCTYSCSVELKKHVYLSKQHPSVLEAGGSRAFFPLRIVLDFQDLPPPN
jgi:hypothetical protein